MHKITNVYLCLDVCWDLVLVWRDKEYKSYTYISQASRNRLNRFGFTKNMSNNPVNPLVKMSLGYTI